MPTSVTVTRGILADLNLVKAEMSKAEGETLHHPDVIERLIACWREQQQKEAHR